MKNVQQGDILLLAQTHVLLVKQVIIPVPCQQIALRVEQENMHSEVNQDANSVQQEHIVMPHQNHVRLVLVVHFQ